MEIIVSILIYIGAITGGNHANTNGVINRVKAQNPHLIEFVNACQHGTVSIKDNNKFYMMEHQHASDEACYIHIYGNGKSFEKTIASDKGCILRLIGIDDLID